MSRPLDRGNYEPGNIAFITSTDNVVSKQIGIPRSAAVRAAVSRAQTGKQGPFKGQKRSAATRRRMVEGAKVRLEQTPRLESVRRGIQAYWSRRRAAREAASM